jgi:hypothetical protein
LLEVPVGRGLAALPHTLALYRSIFHGRPVLNGYTSYYPAGFAERMALATRLPAQDALVTLARDTGVAQILVRSGLAMRAWQGLAERGGNRWLRLAARGSNWLLFDVTPPAR